MGIIAHVDWFSTSLSCTFSESPVISGYGTGSEAALQLLLGVLPRSLSVWFRPMPVQARRPYRFALQGTAHSCRVSWHPDGDHVHIEVPGRACLAATEAGDLRDMLVQYGPLVTRFDVAADILTDVTPAEFVAAGYSGRFRSTARFSTPEGETEYVGSWNSDRFCRVYRYNPPHERSEYLRIEFVFRKQYAVSAVGLWVREGPVAFLAAATGVFRWQHGCWDLAHVENAADALRAAYVPERHSSATLKWLETVCAPALVRLCLEGEITDVHGWLAEHVLRPLSAHEH